MSAVTHQPAPSAIPADPATIAPTTMASEATADPIRPSGTDALMPESRPEVTATPETTEPAPVTATATTEDDAIMTESQPLTEGVLGYKAPGLVKSLRFAKKHFWFNDEAIEPQSLATYLRGEKPEVGHPNAAYASQTGKGLMFFAKRIEDKAQPAGILNLSEVSDITKEGVNEFLFKLHGHKHTFQAANQKDRDNWLTAVEAKAAEAKASREDVVGSEGYKKHISSLTGLSTMATGVAATSTASKPSATVEPDTLDKASETTPVGEDAVTGASTETAGKATTKSRSQSRKRQSIFGKVLGKKEEHDEKKEMKKEEKSEEKAEKKEEKVDQKEMKKEEKAEQKELKREEKAEKKEEKAEDKLEKKEEKAELNAEKKEAKHVDKPAAVEPAPLDAAAVASRVVGEPVIPTEGAAADSTNMGRETMLKSTKRGSVFGSFFNRKDSSLPTERKEKELAPAVPSKDSEPTPVSSTAPQLEDPMKTSTVEPVEASAPASMASPIATSPENKGGIFGFMKQKEAQHQEKKEMKNEEKAEAKEENPATSAPVTSPPVVNPDTKEKRRQSFFNTISGKKEKKSDPISDTEMTDGEGKKSTSNKLGGLFRKASRSTKNSTTPMTDSSMPPAPISKDAPTTGEETPATVPIKPVTESTGNLPMSEKSTESALPASQQTPVSASA